MSGTIKLGLRHSRGIDQLLIRSESAREKPAEPLNAVQRAARDRLLQKYADGTYSTEEVRCLCGSTGGQLIVQRDRYGLPSPSVACRACGVIRTSPRLTDESLGRFYDDEYRPLYNGTAEANDEFLDFQRIRGQNITHFLDGLLSPGSRVVELGCGAGGILLPFRDAGHRVAGCDLGSTYLEAGRVRGLDLRLGDHHSLVDVAPYNLVIMSHIFEHITDPQKLMAELRSMIAPNGLVYIELPGLRGIPTSAGDPLRYFQNAHLWNFDLGTLAATMASYGYRLVKGNEVIRSLFTPDEQVASADAGGYDRAMKALAKAESMRYRSSFRRKLRETARMVIGGERASKLKRRFEAIAHSSQSGTRWTQ